ncbi:hypothetical protein CKO36_17405 [Rhabdochromatium marinum]|nr:hypothetical protein [Rhabdochromatium marinum]
MWVAYKQITDLTPEDVCFIASPDYCIDPSIYAEAGRFECSWHRNDELGFVVPTHEQLHRYVWHGVPECIYQRLKAVHRADSLIWLHLMQEEDRELTDFLCETITEIRRHRDVQGVLTWCNILSVEKAGAQLNLPVMHFELGPLRDPWYRPLGYLDFQGVNGHTEAQQRYDAFLAEPNRPKPLNNDELLHLLKGPGYGDQTDNLGQYQVGIPLQVDDDSNLLAYNRGFTPALVLQYVQEQYASDDILLRPHPAGQFGPPQELPVDRSSTSAAFVRRCQSIVTLNSSVAVEAMLAGLPTTVLGEAPSTIAAHTEIGQNSLASEDALDYLLLGYCVPYSYIFDVDYLSWRLQSPSETAIRAAHLETFAQAQSALHES